MTKKLRILLVGCGNMGGAMLRGWLASNNPPEVVVVDKRYENPKLDVHSDVTELPKDSLFDVIVLAVKPAGGMEMIESIRKQLGSNMEKSTILSVMAGGSVSDIEKACGYPNASVIRIMPNTPCCVSAGAIGVYANPNVPADILKACEDLMGSVGTVAQVQKETDLRAVTAIAGSAPAYVFLLAELLEKAGADMGLSQEASAKLSRATIYGAGKMLHELPESAEQLRKNVTSPGGTTAAALSVFMAPENWPKSVKEATEACVARMKELGG